MCWFCEQAAARALRLRRQAELDALHARTIPDYARWKPPVVEDLTQRGEEAESREGRDSGAESGVTALMVEEQGEGANIQNEIWEITQSRQDAKGKRGEGTGSGTKGEWEFITLMVVEQGEGANIQNEIEGKDAKEERRESGTMGGCVVMPLMIQGQGERVNIQNETGRGALGRIDEGGARSGHRPMEQLSTRKKRRRRRGSCRAATRRKRGGRSIARRLRSGVGGLVLRRMGGENRVQKRGRRARTESGVRCPCPCPGGLAAGAFRTRVAALLANVARWVLRGSDHDG